MNNFRYMKDRSFSGGRDYIGASDMPTLASINPYQTPADLWRVLTKREVPFSGNARTAWGHKQEPLILAEYVKKTYGPFFSEGFLYSRIRGANSFKNMHSWTEADAPGVKKSCAHADLLDLTMETPLIIQAKNSGFMAANARKRDPNKGYDKDDRTENGTPLSVYYQEQWELFCYGIQSAYVAVLIDGWDWNLYGPINYNKKIVENLAALVERMNWHVDKDIPPEPKTWNDIVKMFPDYRPAEKSIIEGKEEIEARTMIAQYAKLTAKEKALSSKKDDICKALGLFLGPCQYLTNPTGDKIASATIVSGRESVNLSDLKKSKPELYGELKKAGFIKQSADRRQLYISGAPAGTIDLYRLAVTFDGEKWQKTRKKYTAAEKRETAALLKSLKIEYKFEKEIL